MSQVKKYKIRKKAIFCKNSLTLIAGRNIPFTEKRKGTPLYTSLPGFYLVEAAISIPVFICFSVCILFFFCVMQLQMDVQASLNYTGRKLAEYAVLENQYADKINPTTELAAAEVIFRNQLREQNVQKQYIQSGTLGIHLLDSEFEGDYIHLKAVYRIKLPIQLFGKHVFVVRQQAKVRKWTGDRGSTAETGDWVYITPTGTAYHASSACPYLDLSIRNVSYTQVSALRNKSGAKYNACKECGIGAKETVYITDYGDVYHGSITCSGIKRSVQKIKKSETGSRHACIKCGG